MGQEDPLEKEMVTHSSILAWRIPWTEQPGRIQSKGSQRVRHDWMANTSTPRPLPYQLMHLSWWLGYYPWSFLLTPSSSNQIKTHNRPGEEKLYRSLLSIIERPNNSVWQNSSSFKSVTHLYSLPGLFKVGRQLLAIYLHNGFLLLPLFFSSPN